MLDTIKVNDENCFFLSFFSCLVGTLLGAFTGALIGQETESGFIRGAEIGAFYGAVVSIEVFQSSIQLWRLDESCLVYLVRQYLLCFQMKI